jgi:AbrB family looped-hinge helix DNA binding protein
MIVARVAKVLPKGQVTIPKTVREALGIVEGDYLAFVQEDGVWTVERQPASLGEYMRQVGEHGRPMTEQELAEIDASGLESEQRKESRFGI